MVELEEDVALTGIRHDMVEAIWEKAKPHLEKALEHSDGEFEINDVLKFLLDRAMQLWVLYDTSTHDVVMAGCTEIVVYPNKKICRVVLMGGLSMNLWQSQTTAFEEWAREQGCTQMETLARKGLAKKLTKLDYRQVYQVCRKDI